MFRLCRDPAWSGRDEKHPGYIDSFIHSFIHSFINYISRWKNKKLQVLIYIDKKDINNNSNNNKVNYLCVFYLYESQSSNFCFANSTWIFRVFSTCSVLSSIGSYFSLFLLVAVAIIWSFICHSFKSAIHGLWQLTIGIPRISYVKWYISKPKYLIHVNVMTNLWRNDCTIMVLIFWDSFMFPNNSGLNILGN